MKKINFSLFLALFTFLTITPSSPALDKMLWFKQAKLGIFIHWGIYAVDGIDESWSFFNGYISYRDYMKQLQGFTARNYDPDYWASLIRESGAKYAVLTAKHHDGVALWDTRESSLNVRKKSPAGRDLIKPYCDALRKKGIKAGLYFSLLDWSHPDYPNFLKGKKRYENDPRRWNRFLKFTRAQLKELFTRYQPDLIWFDGDWEQSPERWGAKELRETLLEWNPGVIINSRLGPYGDYLTPEQSLPVLRPKADAWELCMTMNDSWGYQPNDKNYKTTNQIIRIFVDCISQGGNLLLDIGPKEDGTIPAEQVTILRELGRWVRKHAESIYGSRAGIPWGHYYGPTTLSEDGKILYLFISHRPNGPLAVKGLINPVQRIRVVGKGTKLSYRIMNKSYWSKIPGILYITIPEYVLDREVTVLAVQLEGKIQLYRETEG